MYLLSTVLLVVCSLGVDGAQEVPMDALIVGGTGKHFVFSLSRYASLQISFVFCRRSDVCRDRQLGHHAGRCE